MLKKGHKNSEPEVEDDFKERASFRRSRADAHISSQRLWHHTHPDKIPALEGESRQNAPHLTKKVFAII